MATLKELDSVTATTAIATATRIPVLFVVLARQRALDSNGSMAIPGSKGNGLLRYETSSITGRVS